MMIGETVAWRKQAGHLKASHLDRQQCLLRDFCVSVETHVLKHVETRVEAHGQSAGQQAF